MSFKIEYNSFDQNFTSFGEKINIFNFGENFCFLTKQNDKDFEVIFTSNSRKLSFYLAFENNHIFLQFLIFRRDISFVLQAGVSN